MLVAYHDERLDRLTDLSGPLRSLTFAEVAAADAGFRSEAWRGRGCVIPPMEEVLRRWPSVRVNVEPKSDEAVGPLVRLLDDLDAWDRVCVGSFHDSRLREVRRLRGARACTSTGVADTAAAFAAASLTGRMPRLGADCLQVPPSRGPVPVVTERFLAAAHRAGLPVHVWTVDEEAEMHELLDRGVDGLMTDRPRVLREVFAARGLSLG